MSRADWSFEIDGYDTATVPQIGTVEVTGLGSTVVSHDTPFDGADGAFPGLDVEGPRLIGITLTIRGAGATTALRAVDAQEINTALRQKFRAGTGKAFTLRRAGLEWTWDAVRTRGMTVKDARAQHGLIEVSAQVFCPTPDPDSGDDW
jgi:hypothetical protein